MYRDVDRPSGFQGFKAPTFPENWHMKVAGLSALTTDRLNPQILISVKDRMDPRALVWMEGLNQWNVSMALLGVEKAIFRVVTQCLNQRRRRVPLRLSI